MVLSYYIFVCLVAACSSLGLEIFSAWLLFRSSALHTFVDFIKKFAF